MYTPNACLFCPFIHPLSRPPMSDGIRDLSLCLLARRIENNSQRRTRFILLKARLSQPIKDERQSLNDCLEKISMALPHPSHTTYTS